MSALAFHDLIPTYKCPYLNIYREDTGFICKPVLEQKRKNASLKPQDIKNYQHRPLCPSDVKRDDDGRAICWEAKQ